MQAEIVALALPMFCELVLVLSRGCKIPTPEIAETIRRLIDGMNVVVNRPAVKTGFAMLDSGGDFADGVIGHEGRWLGGDFFVSFDHKAAALIDAQKEAVRLL